MNAIRGQYFQMILSNRFGGYELMAVEQAVIVDIFSHLKEGKQPGTLLTEFEYTWNDFKKFCVKAFPEANLDDDDHLSDFIVILEEIFASDSIKVENNFKSTISFDFSHDAMKDN